MYDYCIIVTYLFCDRIKLTTLLASKLAHPNLYHCCKVVCTHDTLFQIDVFCMFSKTFLIMDKTYQFLKRVSFL